MNVIKASLLFYLLSLPKALKMLLIFFQMCFINSDAFCLTRILYDKFAGGYFAFRNS